MTPRERLLLGSAFAVSLVATGWSLTLSGIGPTGWRGLGLFPCELCWYQRILMYPLPILLSIGLAGRDERVARYVVPLSAAGIAVAAYHVLLQRNPAWEVGECFVGSCTAVDWRFLGTFTIPQLSLVAFALVFALSLLALLSARDRSPG